MQKLSKIQIIAAAVFLLLFASAAFASGYLYRGQVNRAPIIIEKCSDSL